MIKPSDLTPQDIFAVLLLLIMVSLGTTIAPPDYDDEHQAESRQPWSDARYEAAMQTQLLFPLSLDPTEQLRTYVTAQHSQKVMP